MHLKQNLQFKYLIYILSLCYMWLWRACMLALWTWLLKIFPPKKIDLLRGFWSYSISIIQSYCVLHKYIYIMEFNFFLKNFHSENKFLGIFFIFTWNFKLCTCKTLGWYLTLFSVYDRIRKYCFGSQQKFLTWMFIFY